MLRIKTIKPLFTTIVTTCDRYGSDQKNGSITVKVKGSLKQYQKVLAVGPTVRDIQVGDTVMLNMDNYAVKRYDANSVQNDLGNNKTIEYSFNYVIMDDGEGNPIERLLFNDRDVLYVFEGEEVDDSVIKTGSRGIIMP